MSIDEALELLGVTLDTPHKQARRAYLRLLKKHKPETDPEGFMRLRAAWELIEVVLRRQAAPPPQSPLGPIDENAVFRITHYGPSTESAPASTAADTTKATNTTDKTDESEAASPETSAPSPPAASTPGTSSDPTGEPYRETESKAEAARKAAETTRNAAEAKPSDAESEPAPVVTGQKANVNAEERAARRPSEDERTDATEASPDATFAPSPRQRFIQTWFATIGTEGAQRLDPRAGPDSLLGLVHDLAYAGQLDCARDLLRVVESELTAGPARLPISGGLDAVFALCAHGATDIARDLVAVLDRALDAREQRSALAESVEALRWDLTNQLLGLSHDLPALIIQQLAYATTSGDVLGAQTTVRNWATRHPTSAAATRTILHHRSPYFAELLGDSLEPVESSGKARAARPEPTSAPDSKPERTRPWGLIALMVIAVAFGSALAFHRFHSPARSPSSANPKVNVPEVNVPPPIIMVPRIQDSPYLSRESEIPGPPGTDPSFETADLRISAAVHIHCEGKADLVCQGMHEVRDAVRARDCARGARWAHALTSGRQGEGTTLRAAYVVATWFHSVCKRPN